MKQLLKDIIVALIIVFVITAVVKPTIVKEHSMEPTLYENNYLLINKLAYTIGDEERGDIIVFRSNIKFDDAEGDGKDSYKLLIKRIIGLPGDVVNIHDGDVYINGQLLNEDYLNDGTTTGEVIDYTVPEDCFFVMGDNRLVSIDSRDSSVGCVHEDAIMGKAFVRLYPFNEFGGLY